MDKITTIAVAYATIIETAGSALVETQYIRPTLEALRDHGHRPCGGATVHDQTDNWVGTYIYIDRK